MSRQIYKGGKETEGAIDYEKNKMREDSFAEDGVAEKDVVTVKE